MNDTDRTAAPDVLIEALGGSVLPMVVSPKGQPGEEADLVILVDSVEDGIEEKTNGLPKGLVIRMVDYRASDTGLISRLRYEPVGEPEREPRSA